MSPVIIISCIGCYFLVLLFIAWRTGRRADDQSYFLANKSAPWLAVALGMLSDSLSGVTFISVPGMVGTAQFSYLQVVLGYFFGYLIIAQVLLPLYYQLNLTSVYSYLQKRFGKYAQKTGASLFLLSRLLGAAARLYLTASVIQLFVFDSMGIPFWLSVTLMIALILLYTYEGGIKTLIWTDVLQSGFLLLGVLLSIFFIAKEMNLDFSEIVSSIMNSGYTKTFFWDWHEKSFFPKQFIGGMFIAIAMTGLDQNMMQKNLSCRSLKDAQKNIRLFSVIIVIVNVFFLSLGALLYMFAGKTAELTSGISQLSSDHLFPTLALHHLNALAGIAFIVGLTAATFSSADSVLTTLTTSFLMDIRGKETSKKNEITRERHFTHIGFAVILLGVILLFNWLNRQAIIDTVLLLAGYTYGPLLGLFAFGLYSKRKINDALVPLVCVISPAICYVLNLFSVELFGGYQFGLELLIVNGGITFGGLCLIGKRKSGK